MERLQFKLFWSFLKVMVLVLFVFNSLVQAQTIAPKNRIKSLHGLKGNWNVDHYALEHEDWKLIGTTQSNIQLEHNGQFISEKVKYLVPFGEINMITNIGYDNRIKQFKLAAMDKEYGYMDIYFGEWIKEDLVFTNLKSDTPIRMEDGRELSFRLTYSSMNRDGFTHLVEGTYDGGITWFIFSKSSYSRVEK